MNEEPNHVSYDLTKYSLDKIKFIQSYYRKCKRKIRKVNQELTHLYDIIKRTEIHIDNLYYQMIISKEL